LLANKDNRATTADFRNIRNMSSTGRPNKWRTSDRNESSGQALNKEPQKTYSLISASVTMMLACWSLLEIYF
jgi:hypothetical protein